MQAEIWPVEKLIWYWRNRWRNEGRTFAPVGWKRSQEVSNAAA